MADLQKRLPENVAGDFYVDTTCINCDTCRQIAPALFDEVRDYAYVYRQPRNILERRLAIHALLACPTGAIGSRQKEAISEVISDFPLLVENDVFYCGFTSPKSFGGSSYFVQYAEGNWLIDSPRYLPRLVKAFDALGGIRYIFLTHQDDVAEAHRYAARFGSERIIHKADLAAQPEAEIVLNGNTEIEIIPNFIVIPTPGHTRGHCVLLYKNRFLFTGDHLSYHRKAKRLDAFRRYCWYSWSEQIESMKRLLYHSFEWILPGHGQRIQLPPAVMHENLTQLISQMGDL